MHVWWLSPIGDLQISFCVYRLFQQRKSSVQYGFSKQTFTPCNLNCTLTGGLFIRIVYITNSLCGRFSIVVSLARSFIVFFFYNF